MDVALAYVFGDGGVVVQWRKLRAGVDAFLGCAQTKYRRSASFPSVDIAECTAPHEEVLADLQRFAGVAAAARTSALPEQQSKKQGSH